jgi:hypothetical protein
MLEPDIIAGQRHVLALPEFYSGASLKVFKSRNAVQKGEYNAFRASQNKTEAELEVRACHHSPFRLRDSAGIERASWCCVGE